MEKFGKIFADSEELIVFPISKCHKMINFYHYDKNNNYISKYVIESIKALLYLNYKVIFYTNLTKPFNFSIPPSIIIKSFSSGNDKSGNDKSGNDKSGNDYDCDNLNSGLIFPCCELSKFQEELNNNKLEHSVIKLDDYYSNRNLYKNNKYINYLMFYK